MNKSFRKIFLVAVCSFSLAGRPFAAPSETPGQTESVGGEAARAIFGRVFGVQGEGGDIEYHVLEMSGHSPVNSSVRSALLPGWGQFFNRQRAKGSLFFLGFTGAVAGSFVLYNRSGNSHDDYLATGGNKRSHYDDYKRERTGALVLAGVATTVWVFGVLDAYNNAYNPLYSRTSSVELSLLPEGGEVRWQKKF